MTVIKTRIIFITTRKKTTKKQTKRKGRRFIKAKDIKLACISDAFPEQYDAVDSEGNVVGYRRLRWGFFPYTAQIAEEKKYIVTAQ